MIAFKFVILILLLNNIFGHEYSNTVPVEIMEIQQNDKRTFDGIGITRMLRDPGWRHIGLGKRSNIKGYKSGKTWALIGLGR